MRMFEKNMRFIKYLKEKQMKTGKCVRFEKYTLVMLCIYKWKVNDIKRKEKLVKICGFLWMKS